MCWGGSEIFTKMKYLRAKKMYVSSLAYFSNVVISSLGSNGETAVTDSAEFPWSPRDKGFQRLLFRETDVF